MSHRLSSCRIIPQYTASLRMTPRHIVSRTIALPHRIASHHAASYRIIPHRAGPRLTIPHRVTPTSPAPHAITPNRTARQHSFVALSAVSSGDRGNGSPRPLKHSHTASHRTSHHTASHRITPHFTTIYRILLTSSGVRGVGSPMRKSWTLSPRPGIDSSLAVTASNTLMGRRPTKQMAKTRGRQCCACLTLENENNKIKKRRFQDGAYSDPTDNAKLPLDRAFKTFPA